MNRANLESTLVISTETDITYQASLTAEAIIAENVQSVIESSPDVLREINPQLLHHRIADIIDSETRGYSDEILALPSGINEPRPPSPLHNEILSAPPRATNNYDEILPAPPKTINYNEAFSNIIFSFKVTDTVVDFVKLVIEPTSHNFYQLTISATILHSTIVNFNYVSFTISTGIIAKEIYEGKYQKALEHTVYISLPYIAFASGTEPSLSYLFLTPVAVYSGVNTIVKLASLIECFNSLKILQAYCDISDYLAQTPLALVYDFGKFEDVCHAGNMIAI